MREQNFLHPLLYKDELHTENLAAKRLEEKYAKVRQAEEFAEKWIEEYYHQHGFDNGKVEYCMNEWGETDGKLTFEIAFKQAGKVIETEYYTARDKGGE